MSIGVDRLRAGFHMRAIRRRALASSNVESEKNMYHAEVFALRALLRSTIGVSFAVAFALALLVGAPASIKAQGKLTPAQEQTLSKCLIGCKKGDVSCQNSCTSKVATPAYFSAAGACVRACADALAGPGQQDQSRAGDLAICVRACN